MEKRKTTRLKDADYNCVGSYFITICTQNRRCVLSRVISDSVIDIPNVGTGVPDGPSPELLPYGKIAKRYLEQLNAFYDDISVEHYVIMPNHIHMILSVNSTVDENGPSRTPVPTRNTSLQNSAVSRFISTFKRFCNKEYGENIWQYRSYDHVIRNQKDYDEHVKYIYENPFRWQYDKLYSEEY